MIKIPFEVETKYGVYKDCLYFEDEKYKSLSEDEIEKMKQDRVNAWISVIETPVTEENTKEQLISEQAYLEKRLEEVKVEIEQIENKTKEKGEDIINIK